MRFGVVLPTSEIGNDPVAIRDFAQAAEDLGYCHILAYDHVLGAVHEGREPRLWGPYTERDAFHEPLVLFGYLAAVTRRIELVTAVLILAQRQAALVAKQATEIQVLSQGRLRLGLGTGWNYVEYEALGTSFQDRGAMLDEQVGVLRDLWRQPVVDIEGRYHRIDRAGISPRPETAIPIWFGGGTLPSVRRAARIGDGYLFGSTRGPVFELASRAQELVAAEGRDPGGFGLEAIIDFADGAELWRAKRDEWEQHGGTHYSFRAISAGAAWMRVTPPCLNSVSEHIAAMEDFLEAVK